MIIYEFMSGRHKTELNLLIVRKQQLWKIKDCKAVAGEYATPQHKPVVFVALGGGARRRRC